MIKGEKKPGQRAHLNTKGKASKSETEGKKVLNITRY